MGDEDRPPFPLAPGPVPGFGEINDLLALYKTIYEIKTKGDVMFETNKKRDADIDALWRNTENMRETVTNLRIQTAKAAVKWSLIAGAIPLILNIATTFWKGDQHDVHEKTEKKIERNRHIPSH